LDYGASDGYHGPTWKTARRLGLKGRTSILVVDDDEAVRAYLAGLLENLGYEVLLATSGEEALERLASGKRPRVILLDLIMPGLGGLELLDRVKQSHPGLPVIVLSTEGQVKTVVEAMRRGANDYLRKPFEDAELELAIEGVVESKRLRDEVEVLRHRLDGAGEVDFVSSSPKLARIKDIARQVADTDAPVLILGESGVGKEIVARYIHAQSSRRDKALVNVNCAALPQELLESELFGYERGAFSGADRDKPGKFELADKGTILLDEIGEMSSHLQAKLLHVLQDGSYNRLGGRHTVKTDARVLASTNSRLEESVSEGRFREDLYFRLNVIRVEVPPLRERREEIPVLTSHFLKVYAARYRSPVEEAPEELLQAFMSHDWPGNVRELENAVRRYLILPDVELALGELGTGRRQTGTKPTVAPKDVSLKEAAAKAADEVERGMVLRVLGETRWNRRETARRLRISYKALLNKLKRWDVTTPAAP
jgi:two-component system response regulator AtoC